MNSPYVRFTSAPRTLTMVLAGGEGKRLHPLTIDRAKPAVPFGGHYRLIDFALSNLVNADFRQIVVLTQYKSHSLDVHISLTWRLPPLLGNFVTAVPAQMRQGPRWFLGSADAIYQNLNLIDDHEPEYVLVFGADHIYRMDLRPMLEQHIESGAGVTIAAIRVPRSQAHQFGVIDVGEGTRIKGFLEKPSNPPGLVNDPDSTLVSMGNYVFSRKVLVDLLHEDASDATSRHDIGGDLVPRLVEAGEAHVYDFTTNEVPGEVERGRHYWRDVGTLDSYFEAHMDLVSPLPIFDLYNPEWPIHTWIASKPPAKIVFDGLGGPSEVSDSVVCVGSIISGAKVRRSVLSPGVVVNARAVVENSILLDDVVVEPGARVRNAIIDKNVVVPAGSTIGYDAEFDLSRGLTLSPNGIVAVPKNFRLTSR